MSHLQPAFISKAKNQTSRSRAPNRMPANMVRKEASRYPYIDLITGKIMMDCSFWPDHRIFVLRK